MILVMAVPFAEAARTQSSWFYDSSGFIYPAQAPVNVLIQGPNNYLNFGTFSGSSGYGFRDNGGVMEFKNSGGSWTPIGSGGSGSSFAFPFTPVAGGNATTTTMFLYNGLYALGSTTIQYASTTAISAGTICIATDCRTAWPSGGGGASTDKWATSTTDSTAIYPNSAAKVGIGSTTPSATLGVQGNALISGDITSVANLTATGTVIVGGNILPSTALGASVLGNSSFRWNTVSVQNVNATNQVLGRFFDSTTGNAMTIRSDGGNTQGIIITTAGLIGVGATSTPARTLSVQGSGLFSGDLSVANLTATGTLIVGPLTVNSTSINYNGAFSVDTGGSVAASNFKAFAGSANGVITFGSAASATTASRNLADAFAAFIINQTNAGSTGDILDLQAAGVTKVFFLQNGNSGLGTSSPSRTLSVQGQEMVSGTSTVGALVSTSTAFLNALGTPAGAFLAVTPLGQVIATTSPSSSSGTAVTGMTLVSGVASTSSTGGSFPLATTTPANAGEYITMTMECTKPGGAGSTDWKLDAWNSVTGTTTIGHSQMQQTGGTNPNMSLVMSGGYQVPSTGTVRFSWTDTSNSISDSTVCQSVSQFDFHYERYAPVATPVGAAGSITSGGAGQLAWYSASGTTISGSADAGIFNNLLALGTTTPVAKIDAYTTASSTTMLLEAVSGKGGCLMIKDTAGSGYTQVYSQGGILFSKVATSLSICN